MLVRLSPPRHRKDIGLSGAQESVATPDPPKLSRVAEQPLGQLARRARQAGNSRDRRPQPTGRRTQVGSGHRVAPGQRAGRRRPEPLLVTQPYRSPIQPEAAQTFPPPSGPQLRRGFGPRPAEVPTDTYA